MTIGFDRPIGAAADVAELEYISALMQTQMPNLRLDGSIRDEDIVLFLSSRYGIKVSPDEVRTTIMKGLGGGDGDDVCIDLMEMVAILLIPTLIKAADGCKGPIIATEEAIGDRHEEADSGSENPDTPTLVENCRGTNSATPRADANNASRQLSGAVNLVPAAATTGKKSERQPLKPHPDLLKYVLKIVLHDITGDSSPKPLSVKLIRDIFLSYGEAELANNDVLLIDMLTAAGGREGQEILLDVDAFARALTDDVKLYDVKNEVSKTTNYFDVFKTHQSTHKVNVQPDLEWSFPGENDGINAQRAKMRAVKKKWTASAIDMAAGTFRSKLLVVILWVGLVVSYFAYYYDDTSNLFEDCQKEDIESGPNSPEAFLCRVIASIVRWFAIFFSAGFYGLGFVGLGSLGNAIERQGRAAFILPWVGIFFILVFTATSWVDERRPDADAEDHLLYEVTLLLGYTAVAVKIYDFIALCIPQDILQEKERLAQFFTPLTFKAESALKQAASYKMNKLVGNALDLQKLNEKESVVDTHYGQALLAYAKLGEKYEHIGGFKWAWEHMRTGDLFWKEGVWLSARLLAGNTSIILASIWVLTSGVTLTRRMGHEFDNADDEAMNNTVQSIINSIFPEPNIDEDTIQETVNASSTLFVKYLRESYNCSSLGDHFDATDASALCSVLENSNASSALEEVGFNTKDLEEVAYQGMYAAAEQTALSFYPSERYMVIAPFAVATAVAFVTCVTIVFVYIPSVTSTTLQLRSSVIPTLQNPRFDLYRFGADLVTILLGSMFWGSLASSILVGGVVGCIVFFFVWQATEIFAFRFIAFVVGISVTLIIRVIILVCFRGKNFHAFYRSKPARANIGNLFLEAATFGLSVGFIFMRAIKLLLAAGMYIGRIDRNFLAPGVGNLWGYFELDAYPSIFQRDILAHEAHRHPWIELSGALLMMKLRYGESFARPAGSSWRLIFVYALLPWLSKYRILTRSKKFLVDGEGIDGAALQFVSLRKVIRASLDQSMIESTGDDEEKGEEGETMEGVDAETTLTPKEENILLKQEIISLKRNLCAMNMKSARRGILISRPSTENTGH